MRVDCNTCIHIRVCRIAAAIMGAATVDNCVHYSTGVNQQAAPVRRSARKLDELLDVSSKIKANDELNRKPEPETDEEEEVEISLSKYI